MHATTKAPATLADMQKAISKAERRSGDGHRIGGTGLTEIKLRGSPLAVLIDKDKIGAEELRAAQDIELAFFALSGGLTYKPLQLERIDSGRRPDWSSKTAGAVERYQAWANHWSLRAKRGDPTLEITVAAIIDQRAFSTIEEDVGVRHGMACKVTACALRDYAARAGWATDGQGPRWIDAAEGIFRMRIVA
jgi:hypothetical protein